MLALVSKGLGRSGGSIPRPVLTASRPSQTMATMGPLFMSIESVSIWRVEKADGTAYTKQGP